MKCMIIYVCYLNFDYEGSSIPLAAFKLEEDAKMWCQVQEKKNNHADYEELVLI